MAKMRPWKKRSRRRVLKRAGYGLAAPLAFSITESREDSENGESGEESTATENIQPPSDKGYIVAALDKIHRLFRRVHIHIGPHGTFQREPVDVPRFSGSMEYFDLESSDPRDHHVSIGESALDFMVGQGDYGAAIEEVDEAKTYLDDIRSEHNHLIEFIEAHPSHFGDFSQDDLDDIEAKIEELAGACTKLRRAAELSDEYGPTEAIGSEACRYTGFHLPVKLYEGACRQLKIAQPIQIPRPEFEDDE